MPLMRYLAGLSSELHGQALQLPSRIGTWLSYIPATFPTYTRHTEDHSLEVIRQLGCLLFVDGNPPEPRLSAMEAYLLVVAAYLHDAGMVVSDEEKGALLTSDEWAAYVGLDGPGHASWAQLRDDISTAQRTDQSLYKQGTHLRLLIADFLRRSHHLRAPQLFVTHNQLTEAFTLSDSSIERALSAICSGHGLSRESLQDDMNYPLHTDVRSEPVNVRLMTIFLRLADLLDMRNARACPLLLPALEHLPEEGQVYWKQYERIRVHRTTPAEIRVMAECQTQDEHRLLRDWCQWLVDETRFASSLLDRQDRHGSWLPPTATIDGPSPTIVIQPSPSASYIPCDWRFELDPDTVLARFVSDIHTGPYSFLRELLQNAIDASRCRLERSRRSDPPDGLASGQLPIRVVVSSKPVRNSLTGEEEEQQVIEVCDLGIGMTPAVVERYFLQVGRSYYRSEEFRRLYGFVPTSRFGVGFLSVFKASDYVEVKTRSVDVAAEAGLMLTLRGPRKYFLLERECRSSPGTDVMVRLRTPVPLPDLRRYVLDLCRMVEFPIILETEGAVDVIVRESPDSFKFEPIPIRPDETSSFSLEHRSFEHPHMAGTLYVLKVDSPDGPQWDRTGWAKYTYPTLDALATAPPLPHDLVCLHGLASDGYFRQGNGDGVSRIDIRGEIELPMSRRGVGGLWIGAYESTLRQEWTLFIEEHIAEIRVRSEPEYFWKYLNRLFSLTPLCSEYLARQQGGVPVFGSTGRGFASALEVGAATEIGMILHSTERSKGISAACAALYDLGVGERMGKDTITDAYAQGLSVEYGVPFVWKLDVAALSPYIRSHLFGKRTVRQVLHRDGRLLAFWTEQEGSDNEAQLGLNGRTLLADFDGLPSEAFSVELPYLSGTVYSDIVLNRDNAVLKGLADDVKSGRLSPGQVEQLGRHLDRFIRYGGHSEELERYVSSLGKLGCTMVPPQAGLICRSERGFRELLIGSMDSGGR